MPREMKNSGIPWIGQIPSSWSVAKIKYSVQWKSEKGYSDERVLSLYRDYGVIYKDSRDDNHNVTSLDTSGYKYVEPGDLVINKMKAWQGSMAVSELSGIISPAYHVCRITDNRIHKRYFHHLLRNVSYLPEYARLSTGMRIGQWDLGFDDFKNLPFLIPPYSEQQKIAAFLDSECQELDSLIDRTKESVEEYKRLRQSVISHAVTKGIRKNRTLKESGVEWAKHIPVEWESINPKALFAQRKDKALAGERQLTASQQHGVIYQDEYMELTGSKIVTVEKDFDILKHVEAGDFVISMRSFQGGLEYSTKTGSISSAYVMLIPNLDLVFPRYFKWLLKSDVYINALQSTSNMVRDGQAMRYSNFAQVRLFSVPMEEQIEIADYLDSMCARLNELIEQKEQYVSELELYKKSFIYEYVTGKKEVQ